MAGSKTALKRAAERIKQPRPYHHGDLRASLLSAARSALSCKRPELITLKGLASDLGVSQSAPYRHFSTREALLAVVATEGFEQFRSQISQVRKRADRAEELEQCCLAYLAFSRQHPGLYQLMFASELLALSRGSEDELYQTARLAFQELLQRVATVTLGGNSAVAAWIWVTMHGLAMIQMSNLSLGSIEQNLDASDVVREVVRHLVNPDDL